MLLKLLEIVKLINFPLQVLNWQEQSVKDVNFDVCISIDVIVSKLYKLQHRHSCTGLRMLSLASLMWGVCVWNV